MNTNQFGDQDDDVSVHRDHLKRMVAHYGGTAERYNEWHCNPGNDSSHNYAVRETLALMKMLEAKTLLDVCCGTGRAVRAGLDAGFEARGIDVSKELLEIAARDLKIPATKLDQGDATNLPYADGAFDVVCIFGALHHTAMPRAVVKELLRVARLGIIISDEANHLSGGIKAVLVRLGIFEPIYRFIFRRPPRTTRRQCASDTDGPTFVFSIEEIIPLVKERFPHFRCLIFYRFWKWQICSYRFPRLFARQGIISAWK